MSQHNSFSCTDTIKNTDSVRGRDTSLIKLYFSALSAGTGMTICSQSCPTWIKTPQQEASSHSVQSFVNRPKNPERGTYSTTDSDTPVIFITNEKCDRTKPVIDIHWLSLWFLLCEFGLCWCFKWCCWSLQALLHQSPLDRQRCLYTALCASLMLDDWLLMSVDIPLTCIIQLVAL